MPVDPRSELDEFGVRRRSHRFDRLVNHDSEIDRSDVDSQFAGYDARRIEQIINQTSLSFAIASDNFEGPPGLLGVDALLAALDAGVPEHRIQRRAQFVR